MNIQFYFEKLNSSKEFRNFMNENPEAFLCSGFFVIDNEGTDNKEHFDYFSPKQNKIFSFQIENDLQKIPLETPQENYNPEEISLDYDLELKEIENLISQEMEKRGIKNKIQKLIFSLQKSGGKDFLIGTVFISMMGIVKVNIDIKEKKITDFEKSSFFDMVNVFKNKKDKTKENEETKNQNKNESEQQETNS